MDVEGSSAAPTAGKQTIVPSRRAAMRLENKGAIVTGGASGIGKEIAHAFAREGAKIAIADLNQQGADAAAAELAGPDRRAIGVAMDVTNEAQVVAGMAKIVETFGRIDILVSN